MTASLLLGVAAGLGMWVTLVAVRPSPQPLRDALAALDRPAGETDRPADLWGRLGGLLVRSLTRAGVRTVQRDQQLALAGITAEAWARDKIVGGLAGLAVPLVGWIALAAAGARLSAAAGILAVAGAAAGWWLPDLRLQDRVARRRKAVQHALSAYLDLVNVILAGGGGIETALVAAADAGDGWAFARLRHALHRARRINQPLWTAFEDLGVELGVTELRDLASSIGLAGAQGARIRASLAVKADTLRAHQIADTEAAAEATTERMNLPTAVLLLGFLMFVVFPAVTAITAVSGEPCLPGSIECPAPIEITVGPSADPHREVHP